MLHIFPSQVAINTEVEQQFQGSETPVKTKETSTIYKTCLMCQTQSTSHALPHVSLQQNYEVGSINAPILKMRKLGF